MTYPYRTPAPPAAPYRAAARPPVDRSIRPVSVKPISTIDSLILILCGAWTGAGAGIVCGALGYVVGGGPGDLARTLILAGLIVACTGAGGWVVMGRGIAEESGKEEVSHG